MLQGIRYKANPTSEQKLILSQWMGCARMIWNAKCDEHRYYSTFARKYYPIGTFAPIDQKASQFKSKELTPWLYGCPSQIIRNSAVNWYQTYQKFMKGICGKPKRKPKTDKGSIHLTRELFGFDEKGRLFIGTKTNNIGYLSFNKHRDHGIPNSIYIRKETGHYCVSFCFDDGNDCPVTTDKAHLSYLKGADRGWLEQRVIGVDRGVAIPAHGGSNELMFDFDESQKRNQLKQERNLKRYQRRMAKQVKTSNRRKRTKFRIARCCNKTANIRQDFCHKTSRTLVDSHAKVIVFENLNTASMTRKPKAKQDNNGQFLPNKAKAKAGLNKAILNSGWHYLESFTKYKADKAGKAVFKVSAAYTSQECASCGHIHPSNRKTQDVFHCQCCGHLDNADQNASLVIKKRAIDLILDSGTELSGKGISLLGIGRGASHKSRKGTSLRAIGNEASKKKRTAITSNVAA